MFAGIGVDAHGQEVCNGEQYYSLDRARERMPVPLPWLAVSLHCCRQCSLKHRLIIVLSVCSRWYPFVLDAASTRFRPVP